MRGRHIYSSSVSGTSRSTHVSAEAKHVSPVPEGEKRLRGGRLMGMIKRHERIVLMLVGVLSALLAVAAYDGLSPDPEQITQDDIDAAVLHTIESLPPDPSAASVAYQIVGPSVVRVRRLNTDVSNPTEMGVGTGVVITESGLILTSLHVVDGAERVGIVFADGFESDAVVMNVQEENDLAVLQAQIVPDDLVPATLQSSRGLNMGDQVIAVGNPFGIGPSLSSGVISGLGRSYYSPGGARLLTDLIQFDAAANPGNSGGPLVTMDGEVVGIVTAILNPSELGVFIGIGFAVPIETAAAAAGESPF